MLERELKILTGSHAGRRIPLTGEPFIIGRERGCHLRIKSDLVSRQHCVLEVVDDQLLLRDLRSTNGTFINGDRLQREFILEDGDQIQVATLKLVVAIRREATLSIAAAGSGPPDNPSNPAEGSLPRPPAGPANLNETHLDVQETGLPPNRAKTGSSPRTAGSERDRMAPPEDLPVVLPPPESTGVKPPAAPAPWIPVADFQESDSNPSTAAADILDKMNRRHRNR